MMRTALIVIVATSAVAHAGDQKQADRHFKSGVAFFNEAKYTEALAEFERAYEIAPHPLVLYNIASCHRELSHYGQAVKFYRQFMDEGKGKVPAAKLKTAKADLDALLSRVATVKITAETPKSATTNEYAQASGAYPQDMAWHFVRVTHTNGMVNLCVDGKRIGGYAIPDPGMSTTKTPYVGRSPASVTAVVDGAIDDLRVYKGALPCE